MQIFANFSQEGRLPGLGLIEGEIKKFSFSDTEFERNNLRIPHMGWNTVNKVNDEELLFKDMDNSMRFYFVHSFHFVCKYPKNIIGVTEYGNEFVSAIRRDNIFGVQFHPEKSHKYGMKIFQNFMELT